MSKATARSRQQTTERGVREKNYKIFAVNFHGSSLDSIRDEFLAMSNDGRRRNMIVIDLDAELKAYIRKNKAKQGNSAQFVQPLVLTTAAIEQRRQYYDFVTKTIEIEKNFDLFKYWSERISVPEVPKKDAKNATAKNATAKKPLEKLPEKVEKKNPKSAKLPVVKEQEPVELICPQLVQREHNIIGNGEKMSKRKFIEDSPPNAKLFIILLGTNVSKMYMDLLRQGEPLQAIVHFIPELSPYELLVPIPRSEVFLRRTLHEIKTSIDDLRIPKLTKPVGMFQQQLPVISRCLAHKHAEQIYDELSWYFYDLEIIRQQYQLYYFQVFTERNVEMDNRVSVQDLLATAESLTIQGHFLSSPLPAAATDMGTIVVFLEGLISTVRMPGDILTEFEIKLLSGQMPTTISGTHSALFYTLVADYRNAFRSITKITRYGRLAVERVNDIFYSMITYMDMNHFTTLYHCCLEYNIARRYITTTKFLDCIKPKPSEEELEPFYLPQYCKLYSTHDSTSQRLYELLTNEYDYYELNILPSDFRLYHFKRNYNEIVNTEKTMIVPTRLCFRDFTIFQLETFIKDFISPKPPEDNIEDVRLSKAELKRSSAMLKINNDIFIRPPSLKAQKQQIPDIPRDSKSKELKWKPSQFSSMEKSANKEHIGLPPGHPLLYGYNLEDTLQEVFVKTSSYHFEEGSLKRYEDRWCYDELNKNINININECSINLFRPREGEGISRKIQIRTKSDLTCRIYAAEDECSQIVLNYPNGLSVYFYGNTCEQQWSIQETFKFEKQRLFIPEGAIIVHYHAEDVIRILRHNGEVYELFQYELGGEEEEGEGLFFGLDTKTTEPQPQFKEKDEVPPKSFTTATPSTKRTSANTAKIEPKQDYVEETVSALKLDFTKSVKDFLSERYEYELRFFNLIATKYDLTYIHLKVTTTMGRVVYLTNRGMIFEAKPCYNVEWHDYFANESYAMRDDGVKLIWTKDALKCFHKNGSIITTKLDESFVQSEYEEPEPLHISQSSSHPSEPLLELDEPVFLGPLTPDNIIINIMDRPTKTEFDLEALQKMYASKNKIADDMISYLPMEEEEEHKAESELKRPPEEKRFVYCQNSNFMMQHAKYAAVNFVLLRSCVGKIRIYMYILAADDVRVQIVPVDLEKSTQGEENVEEAKAEEEEEELMEDEEVEEETESQKCNEAIRSKRIKARLEPVLPECSYIEMEEGEEEAKEQILKTKLKFNISDDVELRVDEESCQICAVVERNDSVCGKVSDILSLEFQFDNDIDTLYHEFVRIISEFKNYTEPTFKELYFIEKETSSCEIQGFEFYKTLPVLGQYSLVSSNAITDMSSINSITDKMTNKYDWYEKDMKKFPRFRKRENKKQYPFIPRVQSVNTFCKIPRRLQSTDEINKFLEPFDTVNFKRTRRHIRRAMEYHLRPYLRFKLFQRGSEMSWQRRHMIHRRRLFIETQRKGLYHAMLKHKVYPKYFEFMTHFFGHVKNIDFFEYVTYQCMPKEAEKPVKTQEKGALQLSMSAENGKMHVTSAPPPPAATTPNASVTTMMMTTKIKREPGSMLLTNGSGLTKLSSFSPARDLTLGGRGALGSASKKVFTPNLNVVRNKNANVKTSKDTTARGRGGRGKSERGRGNRGGANTAFIQTAGVFSEGAGAVNIRKTTGSGNSSYSRSTADDAPSAMRRPMIIKREHHKIDVQAEAAHVRELLGASDDDDFGDDKTDLEQIPIKLNEAKWKYMKVENAAFKLESRDANVENEDPTASDVNTAAIVEKIQQQVQLRSLGCVSRYPHSVEELLESKQPQIFVMQLPDTLPCEDEGTDSPEKPLPSDAKEHSGDTDPLLAAPAKKSSSNSLKNMEEGQVGKLLRYKSGKIKLVLGESHFDLDMGMETGFMQDLMSINTNREERSGNMVNLGAIQAKLTATPDWEYMLKQQMRSDKP